MNTDTLNRQLVTSGFHVDLSRGERIGRVSSEWFARPDDERFLNLSALYDTVRGRAECAKACTIESRAWLAVASSGTGEVLGGRHGAH